MPPCEIFTIGREQRDSGFGSYFGKNLIEFLYLRLAGYFFRIIKKYAVNNERKFHP